VPTKLVGILAITGGLLTAGCGGGQSERVSSTPESTARAPGTTSAALPTIGSPGPGPAPSAAAQAPATGKSVLPDLAVDDVAAGSKVNLSSLVPAEQPLLVWFWAPH